MTLTLRHAGKEFELGPARPASKEPDSEEAPVEIKFDDLASAAAFVRRFRSDASQMAALRHLVAREPHLTPLFRVGDDDIIDAVARALVHGSLTVSASPLLGFGVPKVVPVPPPPPKPKPKPDPPDRKTAKLIVKVVRTDSRALVHPATVTIAGPSGGSKPTDPVGTATFAGIAPGDYKVTVALAAADEGFELADIAFEPNAGEAVSLAPGGEATCTAHVAPPGSIDVVVVGSIADALLGNVAVSAAGPTKRDGTTKDGTGDAPLTDLKSGKYTLSLTLPQTHAATYAPPKQAPEVTLGKSEHKVVKVVLPERPSPVIEVSDPKIVLVKRSYQDRPELNVKPHRIPVKLSARGDFDGTGELRCNVTDHIRVFATAIEANALALPLALTADQLHAGHTVFVEGRNPSPSVGGTELTLELKGGTIPPKQPTVTEKITCVKLTLEVHKSRPEAGGEPALIGDDAKITPGRHVVEQGATDDTLFAERALVVLKKAEPRSFTGNLVVKPLAANVELFADETPAPGQAALADGDRTVANAAIDAAKGKRFWAQGKTKSGSLGDTGFFVGVDSIADSEGDRVTMSVLKLELRLHKSRTDAAAAGDPDALGDGEKMTDGRFLHAQDTGFHHGRALLIVRKVEPDGFVGKLELTAWNAKHTPKYSASKAGASRVELFADEIAQRGQAATAIGEIDHPANFPADGKRFWVQGKTTSGELRDSELRLGVKDVDKGCQRAAFTVVQFKNLKADIPSTPANTVRPIITGGASNSPVPRHTQTIGKPPAAKDFDEDFAVNLPFALVEASVLGTDPINLTVEVTPAHTPVRWGVVRDRRPGTGDHANIIALAGNSEDPGLTEDPNDPLKATLTASAVGSFHVCPYVDGNGNGSFDFCKDDGTRIDREPYLMMNLILIRVEGISNLSVANSAAGLGFRTRNRNFGLPAPDNWGVVPEPFAFNTGDFNGTGNDAVFMDAIVRVIGGGQDGKRGLDRLYCSWAQDELDCPTSPSPGGLGEDVTHFHQRTAVGSPVRRLRCFWQLNGADIGGPVNDISITSLVMGGNTCTGTGTGTSGPNRLVKNDDPSGIGQRWQERNWDSPGGGIHAFHTADNRAWLRRFTFNIDFRADMVFWTNIPGSPGPADHPACRLYSSVQTLTWNIRFEVTFTAGFAPTFVTAKTVTLNLDPNPTRRATPVDGSRLETRLPRGLTVLRTDQPF